MIVILAEKPSQANAYADAFSNVKKEDGFFIVPSCDVFKHGAKITWGIGHLVTLKEPHEYVEEWKKWSLGSLPLVPETFEFKVANDKKKQFNIVKRLLKEAKEIIIATDCDREGENIARSIISLSSCDNKPIKRLWINSLVEAEVIRGFQNLKNGFDYLPLYDEAQARQMSDWLVGLNGSRLYTLALQKLGAKEVFSVGRVQTPTLKLIFDRQRQIDLFKPEPFFELEGLFEVNGMMFKGKNKERFSTREEVGLFLEKQNLQTNKEAVKGVAQEVVTKQKREQPPKLHSLSSLQSLANKKYKYSPSAVLKIVQELYDTPLKLVTYPRTDNQYVTENEFAYLKANFENYQQLTGDIFTPSSLEANKRYVDNQKVKEHYAIVPTDKIPNNETLAKLSEEQRNIYFEIVKSVLAMFHFPYEYDETIIETNVKDIIFITKGKTEKSVGWKELFQNYSEEKQSDNEVDEISLPVLSKGECYNGVLQIKEGVTTPPKRYTEGQLINLMKTSGKFVDADNKEAKAILDEVEGLGTEATRSGIIETLKAQNYIEIKKNIVYVTEKGAILCGIVDGTMLSKPDLTAEWEGYLKKIGERQGDKNVFVSQTIQFTHHLVDSVKKLLETAQIDLSDENKGIAPCPTCKKGMIVEHGKFYGCTSYEDGCKQTFPKIILEKSLTNGHIQKLCTKGKTEKIKGFKGKKGKFDACLILKDGAITFSFGK